MTLQDALQWGVGGGAGIIAYALMGIKSFDKLPAVTKRYLSLLLASGLASLFFYLQVFLSYQTRPETSQAWLEAFFSVIAIAIGLSQTIHGARVLAKK